MPKDPWLKLLCPCFRVHVHLIIDSRCQGKQTVFVVIKIWNSQCAWMRSADMWLSTTWGTGQFSSCWCVKTRLLSMYFAPQYALCLIFCIVMFLLKFLLIVKKKKKIADVWFPTHSHRKKTVRTPFCDLKWLAWIDLIISAVYIFMKFSWFEH